MRIRPIRNAIVRRTQRFARSLWFWLAHPEVWPLVAKCQVFRLLVWLEDPLADWWWRVSGLKDAYWRAVARSTAPDR